MLDPASREASANAPLLTVGARACQKHAVRRKPGESFWGPHQGITEKQRNQIADRKIKSLLDNAVWLSLVTLTKSSAQVLVEVRIEEGYGARWDVNYTFRGLLEPQDDSLNRKKHL